MSTGDHKDLGPANIDTLYSPLIGKTLADTVVDKGAWLNDMKKAITEANPQTTDEKIALAGQLTKSIFLDGLTPLSQKNQEYQTHQSEIDALLKQHTLAISTVIQQKYAFCLQWHIYMLTALDFMQVPAALCGNTQKHHSFIYTYDDNHEWTVRDPFAETYLVNNKSPASRFPDDYYRGYYVSEIARTAALNQNPPTGNWLTQR